MKTLKIIFFAIIAVVLAVFGSQAAILRKRAAKAKAEASKAKHAAKTAIFRGAIGSIEKQIEIARTKKKRNYAEIIVLEEDHEKLKKKIFKGLAKIDSSESEIFDLNSAIEAANRRNRK